MNGPISIIIIKLSLGSEAWGIKQKKSHSDWGMNNTFLSFYLPMPWGQQVLILLKQTDIQTVENISLLNDRARPANRFFSLRQGICPTRLPVHIINGTNYADFQLIFFKCKANFPLKMISFNILFIWSVWSFFSTIDTIVFRCGTMLVRHFLLTDCYFVSLQYWQYKDIKNGWGSKC